MHFYSRIGRLQLLLEKQNSGDGSLKAQICENFDEVTALWEKVEGFAESVAGTDNTEHIGAETQRLFNRVNQVTEIVMDMQEESATTLKVRKCF